MIIPLQRPPLAAFYQFCYPWSRKKKKITNQLNKIRVLLHAPSHITFLSSLTELKLAQNFFSFRNLSYALSYCYSRIKNTDSDASVLPLALTRGHYSPESSFSTILLWRCCQGHGLKASVGTRIATICPTLECHQNTWISQQVSESRWGTRAEDDDRGTKKPK